MIIFDNNILDEAFCKNVETLGSSLKTISDILDKSNADEIYKALTETAKNKK